RHATQVRCNRLAGGKRGTGLRCTGRGVLARFTSR
ncbi:hypothetical protein ALC62_12525, partial [Cyphomyrmex costatus]